MFMSLASVKKLGVLEKTPHKHRFKLWTLLLNKKCDKGPPSWSTTPGAGCKDGMPCIYWSLVNFHFPTLSRPVITDGVLFFLSIANLLLWFQGDAQTSSVTDLNLHDHFTLTVGRCGVNRGCSILTLLLLFLLFKVIGIITVTFFWLIMNFCRR